MEDKRACSCLVRVFLYVTCTRVSCSVLLDDRSFDKPSIDVCENVAIFSREALCSLWRGFQSSNVIPAEPLKIKFSPIFYEENLKDLFSVFANFIEPASF